MCIAGSQLPIENLAGAVKNTRDNVNSLFGWGNPGTRGEGPKTPPSVTNIYNYGQKSGDTKPTKTKTPNRSSLNTRGGNY
tara:strand:+ start:65 stop:304 length:240 start_codon:yes stop_codon:yes gene_type:complete